LEGERVIQERLPPDQFDTWSGGCIRCPWCKEFASETKISLDDLLCAASHDQLSWPKREQNGLPDPCAITADCPHCARPFMISLREGRACETVLRLLAVRTQADATLMACR
jgi:hypothetical protein